MGFNFFLCFLWPCSRRKKTLVKTVRKTSRPVQKGIALGERDGAQQGKVEIYSQGKVRVTGWKITSRVGRFLLN